MLARFDAGVEQRPQLGALLFGLPLAKAVAVAEDAFFGAGLFFITAGAAHEHVKAVFFNGFEQRHGLVAVARLQRVREANRAAFDGVLQMAHHQTFAHLGHTAVAEFDHFGEVVAGVHVQEREGQAAFEVAIFIFGFEGFFCQAQNNARVFATREQEGRALKRSHGFAQDEDGFFFQPIQVAVVELGQQLLDGQGGVHFRSPIIDTAASSAP